MNSWRHLSLKVVSSKLYNVNALQNISITFFTVEQVHYLGACSVLHPIAYQALATMREILFASASLTDHALLTHEWDEQDVVRRPAYGHGFIRDR